MGMDYNTDICFVILHYNAIEETINLVNSIRAHIDSSKYKIVIVDNASPNNTGIILESKYRDENDVTVIRNNKNIGFAKGNNVGIDYARKYFLPKFICCLNNDTLLMQNDFLALIDGEFSNSNAAVIGPRIYLNDGCIQYSAFKLKGIETYKKELAIQKHELEPQTSFMDRFDMMLKKIIPHLEKRLRHIWHDYFDVKLLKRNEDVIVHGCCIIFTPAFFEVLNGFNPRTFLYKEEELLYLSLKKNDLLSVYNPKIKIRHLEDAATNTIVATSEEKKEFVRKNKIDSLKILIDEMKDF